MTEQNKKKNVSRYFNSSAQEEKVEVFNVDVDKLDKKQLQRNRQKLEKKNKKANRYTNNDKVLSEKKKLKNLSSKEYQKQMSRRKPKSEAWEKRKKRREWFTNKSFRQGDPFPGEAKMSEKLIQKYERGDRMDTSHARTKFAKDKFVEKEEKLATAVKQAARSEILLHEGTGYLEADKDGDTTQISQHDISAAVDITSAKKYFELSLKDFGPYCINYTRNGRFLLMGGAKGHVAAVDWQTKKLLCEINVMETLHDVKWLHQETLFAVAQKQWTYIYDNQGIELHCLKALDSVLRMEFLPYHFLLAAANAKGYISWLDVSIGQKIAGFSTGHGRLDVMCQNPHNAVVCLGHNGGTVTMWSPNVKEPLVKMLCHGGGVRSVAVDHRGIYMATSGIDRKLKIWDLRNYKMLQSYKIGMGANYLSFSQTDLLAAGKGNVVEVYQDCCRKTVSSPYMIHKLQSSITNLQFCPYEDVLGVGHGDGFSSLIIPGAGEANFDALEANPYQTKKQRRQAEVKMLLDKIPAEMIHLETNKIGKIDSKTLQEKIDDKNKILFLKPQKMEFEPKYKMKGKSKGKKKELRKKGVIEEKQRETVKKIVTEKQKAARTESQNKNRVMGPASVLDRFAKKKES